MDICLYTSKTRHRFYDIMFSDFNASASNSKLWKIFLLLFFLFLFYLGSPKCFWTLRKRKNGGKRDLRNKVGT